MNYILTKVDKTFWLRVKIMSVVKEKSIKQLILDGLARKLAEFEFEPEAEK